MTPVIDVSRDGGGAVLIPCSIPRSVTFSVALGECTCPLGPTKVNGVAHHGRGCPARPVRVSCSISGKTWADSFIGDAECRDDVFRASAAIQAANARWALVKALVLGSSKVSEFPEPFRMVPAVSELLAQRDVVYGALADMARCERAYWAAAQAVHTAMPDVYVSSDMQVVDPGDEHGEAPSARWLAAYVEHLVEQIGALP